MSDLHPFRHGEEGTHAVCSKHYVGGKSVCCECTGKTDCENSFVSTEDWMVEFDKKFGCECDGDIPNHTPSSCKGAFDTDELKQYITHLLERERERERKRIVQKIENKLKLWINHTDIEIGMRNLRSRHELFAHGKAIGFYEVLELLS